MFALNGIKHQFTKSALLACALFFLSFSFFNEATAATLSITAGASSLSPGETTTLRIVVNTEGVAINNTEAQLSFPTDLFEIISTSKTNSVLTLWVEDPSFSNTAGIITFNGGVPTPGYIGAQGQILSLVVRAKNAGRGEFVFSNTAVRANDGLGTNVLTGQSGASLTVVDVVIPPSVTTPASHEVVSDGGISILSSTHPDESRWYANSAPEFSWELPSGTREVRTLIGKNASGFPLVSYIPPITRKDIDELPDGTYYFSLRVRTDVGWSDISRRRVNIDSTPPKTFPIVFPEGAAGLNPEPVLRLNASDEGSGVDYYEIRIGEKGEAVRIPAVSTLQTYVLPPQFPGTYTLTVTAVDRAGNIRSSTGQFTIEAIDAPVITYYSEQVKEGEDFKVRGYSYPNATLTLTIREGERVVSEVQGLTGASGDFTLTLDERLASGEYTVRARVQDVRGAQSNETAPLVFTVESPLMTEVIEFTLRYLSIALLGILVLGGFAWVAMRVWFTLQKSAIRMRREAREAERVSRHAFDVLRDGVKAYASRLKKLRRKLTNEEEAFLVEFEEKLREAESLIQKEIRDISER